MKNNLKNNCKVLEDIYPNYIDDICTEESRQLVDEHLKECQKCRQKVENMKKDLHKINPDDDINNKVAKNVVTKIVAQKYFTLFMVALLFFMTGLYSIISWVFNGLFFFSPEQAILTMNKDINNIDIVQMEHVDKNIYVIIYEDGIEFGTGFVKSHLGGLLWTSEGVGGNRSVPIGRPFAMDGRGRNFGGKPLMVFAVKVNDPEIRFIALDQTEHRYNPYTELTTLDIIKEMEGIIVQEVVDGYALFTGENLSFTNVPRGFTSHGIEVPYYGYSLKEYGGANDE